MNYGSEKVTVSYRQERVIVGLCNVRKVFLDAWVVTIGRLGRGVGAGDGDGSVFKGGACRWRMQGAGLSVILVTTKHNRYASWKKNRTMPTLFCL